MIKGLYIHIPFCQNICHYCDFPKMVASPESQADYIDVLLEELKFHKSRLDNVKTIYIGGGTPSSLKDDYLERLLEGIGDAVNLEAIEEYTIEANPNDITRNKIELLKKNKINRV
ncbi:MAG: radical SAM protein, partial [Bacilli bacterium]|nr:radical SAM protein [Bacilli bacterium]